MLTPALLVLIPLTSENRASIGASFDIVDAPIPFARMRRSRRMATRSPVLDERHDLGISAADIGRLPNLELIGALGAGYENIARDAAKGARIVVANGAGTNYDCVADHAFACWSSAVRRDSRLDAGVLLGAAWCDNSDTSRNFSGKRLGVVGLGNHRAQGGAARARLRSRSRLSQPARAAGDALRVVRFPDRAGGLGRLSRRHDAGAARRRVDLIVTADVLDALGPRGYLVNVSRGSVVDTAALRRALEQGVIAGAGLDVYEGEPAPPALLTARRAWC